VEVEEGVAENAKKKVLGSWEKGLQVDAILWPQVGHNGIIGASARTLFSFSPEWGFGGGC
jgi:hypothetical protein